MASPLVPMSHPDVPMTSPPTPGFPASVLAEINGDLAAAARLNQSYSDICYATDLDAEDLAVQLLATARAFAPATLTNYGVTVAKLDDLETALDLYSEKIGSPRLTTVTRRANTESLVDLFTKLRDTHSRMDRLTAYQAARVIIDRPATQSPTAPPSPPA